MSTAWWLMYCWLMRQNRIEPLKICRTLKSLVRSTIKKLWIQTARRGQCVRIQLHKLVQCSLCVRNARSASNCWTIEPVANAPTLNISNGSYALQVAPVCANSLEFFHLFISCLLIKSEFIQNSWDLIFFIPNKQLTRILVVIMIETFFDEKAETCR